MLGAQGAMVTWDAGGNEFIEVIRTVQACERAGIKTVFLTSEDDPTGSAPTMLETGAGGRRHRLHQLFPRRFVGVGPAAAGGAGYRQPPKDKRHTAGPLRAHGGDRCPLLGVTTTITVSAV